METPVFVRDSYTVKAISMSNKSFLKTDPVGKIIYKFARHKKQDPSFLKALISVDTEELAADRHRGEEIMTQLTKEWFYSYLWDESEDDNDFIDSVKRLVLHVDEPLLGEYKYVMTEAFRVSREFGVVALQIWPIFTCLEPEHRTRAFLNIARFLKKMPNYITEPFIEYIVRGAWSRDVLCALFTCLMPKMDDKYMRARFGTTISYI